MHILSNTGWENISFSFPFFLTSFAPKTWENLPYLKVHRLYFSRMMEGIIKDRIEGILILLLLLIHRLKHLEERYLNWRPHIRKIITTGWNNFSKVSHLSFWDFFLGGWKQCLIYKSDIICLWISSFILNIKISKGEYYTYNNTTWTKTFFNYLFV